MPGRPEPSARKFCWPRDLFEAAGGCNGDLPVHAAFSEAAKILLLESKMAERTDGKSAGHSSKLLTSSRGSNPEASPRQ
jgi:hypothetical protein